LEQVSALLREQGKYEDALRVAQECLALSEKNLAKTDPAMAKGLNAIAIAHYSLGAYRQAADEWRQAAETLETALGPRHPALAGMMVREGFSLAEVRDPDSLRILRRAREILAPALGADSPLVASADGNLGMAMIQLGLIDDGRALFEHALTVFERTLGRASWSYAWALYWIGEAHFERGNLRSALRYAHQSWSDAEKLIGTKHPDLAYPLLTEGEAFLAQRDLARAIPLLERSLALREAASVAPDRKARSSFALARALVAAGHDPPRALELARRARDLYRQQAQGFERELQQVERWLSERPDERKITKARAP